MTEGEQRNVDLFEKTLDERNALRDEVIELRVRLAEVLKRIEILERKAT